MKPFRNEKGQTTIVVALAIVLLLGFVALTVDVGRAFTERTGLQRTADLSAISGAVALKDTPNSPQAGTDAANLYATKNASAFRPGQNFASTDCEQLYVNNASGAPPAWTPPPVSCSPPVLQSGTCTNVGGVYSCPQPNPCMDKNGVQLQCVYTRPASRDFHFLFAPVVGAFAGTRILSAQATADSGAGAPFGATLVPMLLLDCPVLDLDGQAVVDAAQTYNPQCPAGGYAFQSQGWNGARVSLFLGSATPSGGNFQAANLQSAPCPSPDQGFGTGGGASNFSAFLEAAPGSTPACATAPGARIHTQPGAAVGPLNHALDNRLGVTGGVSPATCENQTAFNNTLSDPDGDGVFAITNNPASPNPCLVALSMV
ncbi:MAG: putative Flp pilus-assembly TadE/G-like, partial [Actinomycetota bacterium]|nr:putative Flp pilus-assembly TadE/G-like [Actinomycetota bacterium]